MKRGRSHDSSGQWGWGGEANGVEGFPPMSSRTDRVLSPIACDVCPCGEHGVTETKEQGQVPTGRVPTGLCSRVFR